MKRNNENVRFHYVKPEIYQLGITETFSPQGCVVKLYDRERCICDLIHNRDKQDMQLFTQAIKDYFNTKPNTRKLLKYSKAAVYTLNCRNAKEGDVMISEMNPTTYNDDGFLDRKALFEYMKLDNPSLSEANYNSLFSHALLPKKTSFDNLI